MNELYFQFTETVSKTFYLNGKRYTVKHKPMPAGTYRLVRQKDTDHE